MTEELLNRIVSLARDLERVSTERDYLKHKADIAEMTPAQPLRMERDTTDLMAAMFDGRKIEAIKAYRALTGYGLKESKDAVERIMDRLGPKQ